MVGTSEIVMARLPVSTTSPVSLPSSNYESRVARARLGARQVEGDAVAAALRAQLETAAQRAVDANAGVAGCAPGCQG